MDIELSLSAESLLDRAGLSSKFSLGDKKLAARGYLAEMQADSSIFPKHSLVWQSIVKLVCRCAGFFRKSGPCRPIVRDLTFFDRRHLAKHRHSGRPAELSLAGAKKVQDFLPALPHAEKNAIAPPAQQARPSTSSDFRSADRSDLL